MKKPNAFAVLPPKPRGRPRLPAKDRATKQVHFRCTAAEKASYRRKAKPKGISSWLKDLADKA